MDALKEVALKFTEEVNFGSEEVKKELPEDAIRFAKIDVNVKEILSDIYKVKNAVKACEKKACTSIWKVCSQIFKCAKRLLQTIWSRKGSFFHDFTSFPQATYLTSCRMAMILSR